MIEIIIGIVTLTSLALIYNCPPMDVTLSNPDKVFRAFKNFFAITLDKFTRLIGTKSLANLVK